MKHTHYFDVGCPFCNVYSTNTTKRWEISRNERNYITKPLACSGSKEPPDISKYDLYLAPDNEM
jgi:hypothetical protein